MLQALAVCRLAQACMAHMQALSYCLLGMRNLYIMLAFAPTSVSW